MPERTQRRAHRWVKNHRPPIARWRKQTKWQLRGLFDRALGRRPDPHRWGQTLFTTRQWYTQGYNLGSTEVRP